MKNTKLTLVIMAMAIMAVAVAVVSCKKETENTVCNRKEGNTKEAFDLRKIDDISTYLKDFRKKLLYGKGDETMNVDEAAWHLACLANIDLCDASVEFNEVHFDTIEMRINVNGGVVEMGELRSTYEQMLTEIQRFMKACGLDNQSLRFVDVLVSENGMARLVLMTTSNIVSNNLYYNYWYFPDTFGYLDSICYFQFTSNQYLWNTTAKSELERVINIFEGRITPFSSSYVPTRTISFDFPQWIDPYGSPFSRNSRLSVGGVQGYCLSENEMCYCLDSYLGLGVDYLANNYYIDNEYPIYWTIKPIDTVFPNDHLHTYYHRLNVRYGIPSTGGTNPTPSD